MCLHDPETKGMSKFTVPHFSREERVVRSSVERVCKKGAEVKLNHFIGTVEKYQIVRSITIRAIHFVEYGENAIFPFLWSPMVEMLLRQLFGAY